MPWLLFLVPFTYVNDAFPQNFGASSLNLILLDFTKKILIDSGLKSWNDNGDR